MSSTKKNTARTVNIDPRYGGDAMTNTYINRFKNLSLSKKPIFQHLKEKYGSSFDKEVTEAVAVLKHIRKLIYQHPDATIVEVGSGRGLLTAMLAELYPDKKIIAVDKNRWLNTTVYDNYADRVAFYNLDIHSEEFYNILRREEEVIMVGVHLCYGLAISFINIYNDFDNVKAGILIPCCMKIRMIPEEFRKQFNYLKRIYIDLPGMKRVRMNHDQIRYLQWCLYLCSLYIYPVKYHFDRNILSPKNCIIVSKKF